MSKSPFRIYEQLPPPPSDAITYSQVLERMKLGAPLIVADGMGVDSTWMLMLMKKIGITPDLIQFSNTGSEKPETMAYLANRRAWLARNDFPAQQMVQKKIVRVQDHSLEDQCIRTASLPSLAYGGKTCSLKWKAAVMDRELTHWDLCRTSWKAGVRAIKVIGYDNGPSDGRRVKIWHDRRFSYWYILRDPEIGGYDREQCKENIAMAGEVVPIKSACYMCPASKKAEILWLEQHHPELLERAMEIEKVYQEGKHFRQPELLHVFKKNKLTGLKVPVMDRKTGEQKIAWTEPVRGLGRTWSWTDFIAEERERRRISPGLFDFLLEYPAAAPIAVAVVKGLAA